MSPFVLLALAYLLGSIPSAYLAGKAFRGIDLRQHGSGNLGATNVYRVLGWRIALLVFVVDVAKGAVPVLVFPRWVPATSAAHWAIAFGIAAIIGHVRPVFLLWKRGGKGVATAAGVFFALAPFAALAATVIWGLVFYRWSYVSLASLSAAIALPAGAAVGYGAGSPVFVLSVLVCVLVFWTHRSNIGRLRRGQELHFNQKQKSS
ncbi:MAG TPA: glycerol-3-phosphate 1-O-acyltransferase PlsY [Gemmatimonadaceae bacterium]|nr:glycerol-3-phosphate 1-O-acyltransferase PlsY [Gemmatimonadaceae bacterium]